MTKHKRPPHPAKGGRHLFDPATGKYTRLKEGEPVPSGSKKPAEPAGDTPDKKDK